MPGQKSISDYQTRLSNLERDLAKSFERVKELELERDSLRSSLSAPIETVRSKLANALARNVAMRSALEFVGCRVEHPDDSKLPGCPICERIDKALSQPSSLSELLEPTMGLLQLIVENSDPETMPNEYRLAQAELTRLTALMGGVDKEKV